MHLTECAHLQREEREPHTVKEGIIHSDLRCAVNSKMEFNKRKEVNTLI